MCIRDRYTTVQFVSSKLCEWLCAWWGRRNSSQTCLELRTTTGWYTTVQFVSSKLCEWLRAWLGKRNFLWCVTGISDIITPMSGQRDKNSRPTRTRDVNRDNYIWKNNNTHTHTKYAAPSPSLHRWMRRRWQLSRHLNYYTQTHTHTWWSCFFTSLFVLLQRVAVAGLCSN